VISGERFAEAEVYLSGKTAGKGKFCASVPKTSAVKSEIWNMR